MERKPTYLQTRFYSRDFAYRDWKQKVSCVRVLGPNNNEEKGGAQEMGFVYRFPILDNLSSAPSLCRLAGIVKG